MARKPLGAKPESPIVPIALKLKELGYDPIWLYAGKGKQVEGWNKMANEPDDIRNWRGQVGGASDERPRRPDGVRHGRAAAGHS